MGQYFYIVNTAKKQYLHPHKLGEGMKQYELGSRCMNALSYLLCTYNSNGWCNDPIAIIGDYSRFSPSYDEVGETYEDISYKIVEALCAEFPWFKKDYLNDKWSIDMVRSDSNLPQSLRTILFG